MVVFVAVTDYSAEGVVVVYSCGHSVSLPVVMVLAVFVVTVWL